MRRLETRENIERKNKLRKSILSIIILLLLLISTLGYAFLSNTNTSENTGNQQGQIDKSNRISFSYQGTPINLISTYNDIENISVDTTAIPYDYSGKNLYISSKNQGVLQEIGSALGRFSRVQEACYLSCTENLPEKNCSDNLIVWRESSVNKVYQNESCIFIEGDIRSADAFIYKLFNQI